MAHYYDSSVILAAILQQRPDQDLAALWDQVNIRLSSTLVKIECLIGIRRAGIMQGLSAESSWVRERAEFMAQYTAALNCKRLDDDIEGIVRATPALADCRALDAAHLATALYFKPFVDSGVTVISLDSRMSKVARRLGFAILPALPED